MTTRTLLSVLLLLALPLAGCPSEPDDDFVTGDDDDATPDCSADGYEPNDSQPASAALLGGSYAGLTACPADEDWYSMLVPEGGSVSVQAVFGHADGNIDMALYDLAGNVIDTSLSTTDNELLEGTSPAVTYFYVQVFLTSDSGAPGNEYILELDIVEPSCPSDAYEPNDSQIGGAPVSPSVVTDLVACDTDEDWFSLPLDEGDILEVEALFSHAEGDIDLALYNSVGVSLDSSTSATDNEEVSLVAPSSATYWIQVLLVNDTGVDLGNEYDLDVSLVLPTCVPDTYETNDTQSGAYSLGPGSYVGLTACDTDPDWFAISLSTDDVLDVSLLFPHAEGDIDVTLIDAGSSILATSTSTTDDESITWTAAADGDHFLEIVLSSDSGLVPGNSYDLDVTVTQPLTCTTDAYEVNDVLSSAFPVTPGSWSATACDTDDDWFSIDLLATDSLDVDVLFSHAEGDIDIALYDSGGLLLAESSSVTDDESLSAVASSDSTFFLEITLTSDSGLLPGNDYDIGFAVTPGGGGPPPCTSDSYEPNDAQSTAAPVTGGLYPVLQACDADPDWFAIDLVSGESLDVSVTFSHAEGDIDIALYDASSALMASSQSATDDEAFVFPASSDSTYYLEVVLVLDTGSVTGNPYDLSLGISTGGPSCASDSFEPNDDPFGAPPLPAGSYPGLVACSTEDDWFEVSLTAGETLFVDAVFSQAEGDIDIALYDASATNLLTESTSSTDDEDLAYSAPSSTAVLLQVDLVADSGPTPGTPYALDVSISTPSGCPADSFEPNNSQAAAAALSTGSYGPLAACLTDSDWFDISVLATETLEVTLDFVHTEGDIDLGLYDASGALLASSTTLTDGELASYTAPSDMTVSVEVTLVTDPGSPGSSYFLDVETLSPLVCPTDSYEPNDSLASPTAITAGNYPGLSACDSDEDWFSLALGSGDELDVALSFDHNEGDIDLALYDTGGNLLLESNSSTDDEQLSYTAGGDETIAIQVELVTDFLDAGNEYDLAVTVTPSASCPTDAFEPNDSQAAGPTLAAGSYSSLSSCPGDADWFAVDLLPGDILDVSLTFSTADGNIDLGLYDSVGSLIDSSTSSTDNEALSYSAPAAETVGIEVLMVADLASPGNGYDLDLVLSSAVTCPSDSFEPNDSQASAATLASGSYPSLSACETDEDWFDILVDAGEELQATAAFVHSEGDIDLFLYDVTGALLEQSSSLDDDEELSWVASSPETVSLQVVLSTDFLALGNDYDLDIDVLSAAGCPTDSFEPNDSQSTAAALSQGSYPDLSACDSDDDWFEIDLLADDVLDVALSFTNAGGDIDLALYDDLGTLIDASTSTTDDEALTYTAVVAETISIEVILVSDSGGPGNGYALDATITSSAVCPSDSYEPNDSQATAAVLAAGNYPNLGACESDEDWFEIDLDAGEELELLATFDHSEGDIDLFLYDASETLLTQATSVDDDEELIWVATSPETVFIQVVLTSDFLALGNGYELDLTVLTASGCPLDALEPNDSQTAATPMTTGIYPDLSACESDTDWFDVSLTAGDTLDVDLSFTAAGGDIDLFLFDSASALLTDSTSSTDDESLSYVAASDETVSIEVVLVSDLGSPGNGYDLSIAITNAAGCTSDFYEPNNSQAAAVPMAGGLYSGLSICSGDDDWFDIDLLLGDTLDIDLSFLHSEGDIDLALYDSTGSLLDSSTSSTDDESVAHVATAAETVSIEVVLVSDSGAPGNSYDLDIAVGAAVVCPSDSFEPNDSQASATSVTTGVYSSLSACLDNDDWFQVALAAGEELQVDLSFLHSEGNVDLFLFDAAAVLLADSTSVTDDEQVLYTAAAPETVAFQVQLNEDFGIPGNGYELEVTITSSAGCPSDPFEANDSAPAAATITAGTYTGLSACSDDDWYEIAMAAGETLSLNLYFSATGGNIDVSLFDSSTALVDESLSTSDDETVTYTTSSAESLLAQVVLTSDLGSPGNGYTLEANIVSPTSCPTDSFETNDSQALAAPLIPGDYSGLSACPTDEDWFTFGVGLGDTIDVFLEFLQTEGDLDLALYDSSSNLLASATSSTDDEVLSYTAVATDTLALQVVFVSDVLAVGVNYGLEFSLTEACLEDPFEANDSDSEAAPFDLAWSLLLGPLNACPSDDDWLAFAMPAATGTLTFETFFDSTEGDIDLFVYDESLTLLDSSTSSGNSEAVTVSGETSAQDLYIQVVLTSDLGVIPGALYEFVSTPTFADCAPDEMEPNDSQSDPYGIFSGGFLATACDTEDDWYSVEVVAGETLDVALTFLDSDGDIDIFLHDPSSTVVASSTSTTDDELISHTASTTGTYLVQVVLSSDTSGPPGNNYSMVVSGLAPICPPDPFESYGDDTQAEAVPALPVGPVLTSCPGDDDWTGVLLQSGSTLDVGLAFSDSEGDIDLYLVDASGNIVASSTSTTDDESASYTNPSTGYIYIHVTLAADDGSAMPGNAYTAAVTIL